MVTTVLLLLALWAFTVPAVLGLARLLGHVSTRTPKADAQSASTEDAPPENVVALVPRPQNRLHDSSRRAA